MKNEYYYENGIVHVVLRGTNEEMLCDPEDWEKYSGMCWGRHNKGYAQANIKDGEKWRVILFHHLIIDCPKGMHRDHINRNKLDNRKSNLRILTPRENTAMNIGLNKNNTSGHRGVYFDKQKKKWFADIKCNRKTHKSKYFLDIEGAIQARKELEEKYFGKVISI